MAENDAAIAALTDRIRVLRADAEEARSIAAGHDAEADTLEAAVRTLTT